MKGNIQPLGKHIASRIAAIILLVAAVFSLLQPASAQAPTPSDDDVNALAREIYCPVCENIPLDVCPTEACAQWRELIRQKLALGWSGDQVKEYFVQQYGDRVLASPPARGLNWLVYILPPVVILAGAVLVYSTLRHARQVPAAPPSAPPADDAYARQVEDELRRREL